MLCGVGAQIKRMQQQTATVSTCATTVAESIGSSEQSQTSDSRAVKVPFDVKSREWRLMGSENAWNKLREFYRFPIHKAFDNFVKQSGIEDREEARQRFVYEPDFWPTAEDMRAEEARLAEIRAWKPG
jgi:hypothetical protein